MILDDDTLLRLDPVRLRQEIDRRQRDPGMWYYEEKYGLHVLSQCPHCKCNARGAVIRVSDIKPYMGAIESLENQ
jgi:hypothetical protein